MPKSSNRQRSFPFLYFILKGLKGKRKERHIKLIIKRHDSTTKTFALLKAVEENKKLNPKITLEIAAQIVPNVLFSFVFIIFSFLFALNLITYFLASLVKSAKLLGD